MRGTLARRRMPPSIVEKYEQILAAEGHLPDAVLAQVALARRWGLAG